MKTIIIEGGIPGEPTFATVGGQRIDRLPGESLEALQERAEKLARKSRVSLVVIGGLP